MLLWLADDERAKRSDIRHAPLPVDIIAGLGGVSSSTEPRGTTIGSTGSVHSLIISSKDHSKLVFDDLPVVAGLNAAQAFDHLAVSDLLITQ